MKSSRSRAAVVTELRQPIEELTAEEAVEAKGGIGMLLPAVQKVRDAAARTQSASLSYQDDLVGWN